MSEQDELTWNLEELTRPNLEAYTRRRIADVTNLEAAKAEAIALLRTEHAYRMARVSPLAHDCLVDTLPTCKLLANQEKDEEHECTPTGECHE